MITATLTFKRGGKCTFSAHGFNEPSLSALCRALVAAGVPDQAVQVYLLDGTQSLHHASIAEYATLVLYDGERGFQLVPYRPHPKAACGDAAASEIEAI